MGSHSEADESSPAKRMYDGVGTGNVRDLSRSFVHVRTEALGSRPYDTSELVGALWSKRWVGLAGAGLPNITRLRGTISTAHSDLVQNLTQQWSKTILEDFRSSFRTLFGTEVLQAFRRNLLPPNLRSYAEEVSAAEIYDFLEEEAIPLYLVPRGSIAVRLLRATDRRARRQVLSDRYEALIEDCEAALAESDHPAVQEEVAFIREGIGAMRAGYPPPAQALFTVVLDTLILRTQPDRSARSEITNHKKGTDVPGLIDSMGVHAAFVWLPIWNAHEVFWKDNGDQVPHYYTRHASVHGVSKRQFNKRNCIQSLMLVTSLVGYISHSQ